MQRLAVFLDRDGTITEDMGYSRLQRIQLLPKVVDGLKLLKKSGFLLIMITNQPGVAKGIITEGKVQDTNKTLNVLLEKSKCTIDAHYYCPHHPSGTIKEYSQSCNCRKPKAGLLVKAAKDFSLDLRRCFLIGDYSWDIQAGKQVGCKTVLVAYHKRNKSDFDQIYKESQPDFFCLNFYEAAKTITANL